MNFNLLEKNIRKAIKEKGLGPILIVLAREARPAGLLLFYI